jgi:hypothetical protein
VTGKQWRAVEGALPQVVVMGEANGERGRCRRAAVSGLTKQYGDPVSKRATALPSPRSTSSLIEVVKEVCGERYLRMQAREG